MSVIRSACSVCALLWLVACADRAENAAQNAADSTAMAQDSAPEPAAIPAAPVADSGAAKLLPVDEADSAFAEFRRRALRALQQRDTAFLYGMLAPEIKNSFGGDDSIAGFKRIWKMDRPAASQVWQALTRVLTLGGTMQGATFTAPYVFARWPDGIDPFQHVAVTDENVAAYAQPDPTTEVMGRLSHSILPVAEWQGLADSGIPLPTAFARVRLPDGRNAWVRGAQVYSPVGWRAFFERRNDRWVMTLFVAGD
ncbi:MAG: hypothetical protein ACRENP_24950 [Longimicrobiales bacterium]